MKTFLVLAGAIGFPWVLDYYNVPVSDPMWWVFLFCFLFLWSSVVLVIGGVIEEIFN